MKILEEISLLKAIAKLAPCGPYAIHHNVVTNGGDRLVQIASLGHHAMGFGEYLKTFPPEVVIGLLDHLAADAHFIKGLMAGADAMRKERDELKARVTRLEADLRYEVRS